jgi:osmoprotectant transport system substrate-binding protein
MRLKLLLCVAFIAILSPSGFAAGMDSRRPVIVGSKIDTEGTLLGSIILLTLEHLNIPRESRLQFGPTQAIRAALLSGEIDAYPEYTGNGALFFRMIGNPAWNDREGGYQLVKRLDHERNDIVWLQPGDANNIWAIAVRRDLAEAESLRTIEDFARFVNSGGQIKLAATLEFVESPAALSAFQTTYGFRLSPEQIVIRPGGESIETMRAASEPGGAINCAMVYGTDGNISKFGLVILEDSKHAQVAYAPAAVVRGSLLDRDQFPAIGPALSKAFSALSLGKLREMNREIVDGRPASEVARQYLQAEGLLK